MNGVDTKIFLEEALRVTDDLHTDMGKVMNELKGYSSECFYSILAFALAEGALSGLGTDHMLKVLIVHPVLLFRLQKRGLRLSVPDPSEN